MPLLMHLADERNIGSLRRSGIKVAKGRRGVYAMPLLPQFVVSHQWLRELKRGGARTLCAVHFRVPDDEVVEMGHYNAAPVSMAASAAAGAILHAPDPLGMQILVPRPIASGEIHAVRSVPQVLGWRYMPGAHGTTPCGCPACIPLGGIRTRTLRDRYEASE